MITIFGKILCLLGFHDHIEVIDQEYTMLFKKMWPFKTEPTPCTYLECTRCGHNYEKSLTIGFQSAPKEEK